LTRRTQRKCFEYMRGREREGERERERERRERSKRMAATEENKKQSDGEI
jgi:hypothetical protein